MSKLERRKANTRGVNWSNEDIKTLDTLLREPNFSIKKFTNAFPNRTLASIRSKIRKHRIAFDLFGSSYRNQKSQFTSETASAVKPKVVFDAYASVGHQTFKWIEIAKIVYASEIDKKKQIPFIKNANSLGFYEIGSDIPSWQLFVKGNKRIYFFIGDAIDAAAILKVKRISIDLVDLDTCGSTLPVLPTILVLIRPKHLVITHGEFHSMRFQREDVLRRIFMHRAINTNPLPLDVETMSSELDKAVKIAALRAHNDSVDSFWLELKAETWLGSKFRGMLRRYYKVLKPQATSDCINELSR